MCVSTITASPELIDGMVAAHGTAMRPMEQAYGQAGVGNMDLAGDRLVYRKAGPLSLGLSQNVPHSRIDATERKKRRRVETSDESESGGEERRTEQGTIRGTIGPGRSIDGGEERIDGGEDDGSDAGDGDGAGDEGNDDGGAAADGQERERRRSDAAAAGPSR